MRRAATTIIFMLAALGASLPTSMAAQSFGFLFGAPRHRAHQRQARTQVDTPTPVPRPRFATDPPAPGSRTAATSVSGDRPADLGPPDSAKRANMEPPKAEGHQSAPAMSGKAATTEAPKPPASPVGASQSFTPRAPADDPACPSTLAARHLQAEPIKIGPQPDARCTVVEPVKLTNLTLPDGTNVEFPDRPTIACTTADAFSLYVRDLLVPLAKGTFGSPVAAVWTGPGLECRSRDHIFGAKLSAHGQGLAIDIAQLKLADGRMIAVGAPKTDIDAGFEMAARAAACGYFHTVLGPGSDSYHRTHWHFDLEVRGSGGDGKYCK